MIPIYGSINADLERWFHEVGKPRRVDFASIIRTVGEGGEEALHYVNLRRFGVDTRRSGLYVNSQDVTEALESIPDGVREAVNVLVNRFINLWRRRLSNISQYISPATGVNISFLYKPLDAVAIILPHDGYIYALNTLTAAYAAGVKNVYIVSPPIYNEGVPHPMVLAIYDSLKYGYILKCDSYYGLAYLLYGKRYKGYFDRFIVASEIYRSLPNKYVSSRILPVKPVNRVCYLIDGTADIESIILDIYAWLELLNDVRICIVSLNRTALHELVEAELSIRRRALYSLYSKKVDSNVVSILAGSYNEAIAMVSRLSPEYLNIVVERDSMYRLVDYIKNVPLICVGRQALTPYTRLFAGMPILLNDLDDKVVHTCMDYININSYGRVEPDALFADFELLSSILDWLEKPLNNLLLRHSIDSI